MESVSIPETSYGDFSRYLHEKAAARRLPSDGIIEVTHLCNFHCPHCYIPHKPVEPELTTKEFYRLIDVITEEGCTWLAFSGGEPLLRRDFLDIYTYAKKRGLIITLFTNGSLLSPKLADHLRDFPPFRVSMSIYGATRETYRAIAGSAELYDRSMRAVNLLLERKIPFELKTMVTVINKHELWEMKSFAEQLGVKFRYDFFINARIDGCNEPCNYRVSPEEAVRIGIADEEQVEFFREYCKGHWGSLPKPEDLYNCGAGINSFVIDPYGNLLICLMVRQPSYNLRGNLSREGFRQGFYRFFPVIRSRKRKRTDYKCVRCEMVGLCNQCPGVAELENRDPEIPIEYACKLTHLRVQQMKLHPERR